MKRHYLWLSIAPVIAAGGIWAYAQEPNTTKPDRVINGRYAPVQEKRPASNRSVSGQALLSLPVNGVAPTYAATQLGTVQYGGPSVPAAPFVPGVPAVAAFPGHHIPQNEFLELEEGKFKIISKENPSPEDWQSDAEAKQQLSSAVQKLKSSDVDEKELEDSRALLSRYLDAQFDHDIGKREKQISDLQKQIDKLKSQLEKRKTSKEKMIEMRLTLMENETNGLGFPPAWNALPSTNNGQINYYIPANNGPMPNFVPPQSVYASPSFPGSSAPAYNPLNANGYSLQNPSVILPEKD